MGEKLGKYELSERIGGGAYGLVYKALDPRLGRTVAIKVCTATDDTSRRRFYREAEIAGNMSHPNITRVHDFGLHGDIPFLVEEYLEGEDLDEMIKVGNAAELSRRLDVLLQIASGLAYAHGLAVVHRDVKPSNVRVLADDTAKIMDFGTAKNTGMESDLTQSGTTVGTAAYLSPELLQGGKAGPASDIFSFGVLAYELLAGRRPFPARRLHEVLSQILYLDPAPLEELWPDCPQELAAIVAGCLEKEVERRYSRCDAIAADLRAMVRGRAIDPESASRFGSAGAVEPARRDALLSRAREVLSGGNAAEAMLVLWSATGNDASHDEEAGGLVRRALELMGSAAAPPAEPVPRVDPEAAERAIGELRAVFYIGDVEGAGAVLRRRRELLAAAEPGLVRGMVAARLRGVAEAVEKGAEAVADEALVAARRALARSEFLAARQVLASVRGLQTPGGDVEAMLHVVDATQRSHGSGTRLAEAGRAIQAMIARGRWSEAADALAFAASLHGGFPDFRPLTRSMISALGDELADARRRAAGLVLQALRIGRSPAARERPDEARRLLLTVAELLPEHVELTEAAARLQPDPVARLLDAARRAALEGRHREALATLLEVSELADPDDERVADVLRAAARAMLST